MDKYSVPIISFLIAVQGLCWVLSNIDTQLHIDSLEKQLAKLQLTVGDQQKHLNCIENQFISNGE